MFTHRSSETRSGARLTPRRTASWRLVLRALLLAAVLLAGIIGFPTTRRAVLRGAGWTLVVEEPIRTADIIVVAIGSGSAGVVAAADLVQRGIASRVAIFEDLPTAADLELQRRGIANEDPAARLVRQLTALGVPQVERIPTTVTGTGAEGPVLLEWCDRRGWQSVVVVTTTDHSRRMRRVLDRTLGQRTIIAIQPSPYSAFDPDRWWYTRSGRRIFIVEVQKLLLDLARHPLS